MDIDFRAVAFAGAPLLDLIADEQRRKEYDLFLLNVGRLIENALREQIEDLVDEINSAVGAHYRVRLVHEDTSDFVEVRPVTARTEE